MTRGSALARMLLNLGGVTATVAITVGCSCDFTEVRRLDEATYAKLHAEYGSGLVGDGLCSELCGTVPGDSGDSGVINGVVTKECRLVRIDWQRPGVQCENTDTDCGIGRRPAGLTPIAGARFARMAQLEAASVVSFLRLAADLERLGAPAALVEAAKHAAADEHRHAELAATLARRAGTALEPAVVNPVGARPLVEVAIENAVEGCVGETLGAVEAAHASVHDPDPVVRRALAAIAGDEAVHAALSFAVHDWAHTRLDAVGRRRVRQARDRAIRRLEADPGRRSHVATLRQKLWAMA